MKAVAKDIDGLKVLPETSKFGFAKAAEVEFHVCLDEEGLSIGDYETGIMFMICMDDLKDLISEVLE